MFDVHVVLPRFMAAAVAADGEPLAVACFMGLRSHARTRQGLHGRSGVHRLLTENCTPYHYSVLDAKLQGIGVPPWPRGAWDRLERAGVQRRSLNSEGDSGDMGLSRIWSMPGSRTNCTGSAESIRNLIRGPHRFNFSTALELIFIRA